MDGSSLTRTAPSPTPPIDGKKASAEVHHAVPRCLLRLYDQAEVGGLDGEGIQAWVEWEMEAMRWRVPVEIARSELEVLVTSSEVVLEREKHRLLHQSDWRRGKYRQGQHIPAGSRLQSGRRARLLTDQNLAVVEELIEFSESRGHTILELAFSWLLTRSTVASVIAGATSSEQVRSNAAASGWELTDTELAEIDSIVPSPG
jgi:aryl-alcohol dehydrogenase-like predicted oxidoreductase